MANNKQSIEIGHRAYEEFVRIANEKGITKASLLRQMGIAKQTMENYKYGSTPSARALVELHKAGADVMYILVGKKSNNIM